MRNDKGFTLIELLIVIGLLAILMAIAVLQMKSWMDKYNAEGQIRAMFSDLMNARASAMQKNRIYFVTLTAEQYAIYEDSDPAPDGNGALDTQNDRRILQKNTQFPIITNNLGTGTFQLSFRAGGLASNDGYIRIVTSESPEYDCINVSSTRINMGRFDGTNCNAR